MERPPVLDVTTPALTGAAGQLPDAAPRRANPFAHVRDGRIVDAAGTPLLLRGVGLGNWLLPEGYMWGFGDSAASPRQIEALVETLLGDAGATHFWEGFRSHFITEADIERIAAEGFDHVRLPINWRVVMTPDSGWLEDGFACVDRLITWCRTHGLTVLLDLHGAPGGQTGTNIDDSLGRPELFMDDRNVTMTVDLWTEIARRYRDEPTVLGYDLLNEPLPDEWQHRYADELVALYRRLTRAIRAVDPHHLIMYEGTHWATNWDIFTEIWDPNSVLQFHKYWSPADRPSIQRFLDVGAELGLPVYMGEGGENTPEWLAAAFQLYEDCGVGWNFWPWKKIETHSSPCSVVAPEGWDRVLAFTAGTGAAPERNEAEQIFSDLLAAVELRACEYRPGIISALLRRAPVHLPAHGFTFRGAGVSYETTRHGANPGLRADDGVAVRRRDGAAELDFSYPRIGGEEATLVVDLEPGEWLQFDVELAAGTWVLTVHTDAHDHPIEPLVSVGGAAVTTVPDGRAGPGRWSATVVQGVPGRVDLRVSAGTGPITLSGVSVDRAGAS